MVLNHLIQIYLPNVCTKIPCYVCLPSVDVWNKIYFLDIPASVFYLVTYIVFMYHNKFTSDTSLFMTLSAWIILGFFYSVMSMFWLFMKYVVSCIFLKINCYIFYIFKSYRIGIFQLSIGEIFSLWVVCKCKLLML